MPSSPPSELKGYSIDEIEEEITLKYSITSYGADYTIDSLVRRIDDGSIYIPPFQRGYVWKPKTGEKFIESLLLGLPVPGIFLSKEDKTNKLIVIDGQQRLITLQSFYRGKFPNNSDFILKEVHQSFRGLTYKTLTEEDRRELDDSILHATIVRQDKPNDGQSSIYMIFERLNTGGVLLSPQEIRTAMYYGEFNVLLGELNDYLPWRNTYGTVSKNMRDQELILRFFALYYNGLNYEKPMRKFLNDYMSTNRNMGTDKMEKYSRVFKNTVSIVNKCLGTKAFKPKKALNAAVFDSVMIGIARRLEQGLIDKEKLVDMTYKEMLRSKDYLKVIETATTDEENVKNRIDIATEAFSKVT